MKDRGGSRMNEFSGAHHCDSVMEARAAAPSVAGAAAADGVSGVTGRVSGVTGGVAVMTEGPYPATGGRGPLSAPIPGV